jgi:hypothetical protein
MQRKHLEAAHDEIIAAMQDLHLHTKASSLDPSMPNNKVGDDAARDSRQYKPDSKFTGKGD